MRILNYIFLIVGQLVTACCAGQTIAKGTQGSGRDSYTNFFVNAVWPASDEIRVRQVDQALVRKDIDELAGIIKRTIRPIYLPSAEQLKTVVACSQLRDGNDYLLLRYSPADGIDIEIQDGPALYATIVPKSVSMAVPDIAEYVKRIAAEFLNFPASTNSATASLHVWVSALDLGPSKCGTVAYGREIVPPPTWYSYIRWWSDGERVLFEFARKEPDADIAKRASPPPEVSKPKHFLFRQ